jgi:hypothetical protein
MPTRRCAPPWTVEELGSCFVVIDSGGQKLSHVYYEEEPGRRSAVKLLSKDEARRIAANSPRLAARGLSCSVQSLDNDPPNRRRCWWRYRHHHRMVSRTNTLVAFAQEEGT